MIIATCMCIFTTERVHNSVPFLLGAYLCERVSLMNFLDVVTSPLLPEVLWFLHTLHSAVICRVIL